MSLRLCSRAPETTICVGSAHALHCSARANRRSQLAPHGRLRGLREVQADRRRRRSTARRGRARAAPADGALVPPASLSAMPRCRGVRRRRRTIGEPTGRAARSTSLAAAAAPGPTLGFAAPRPPTGGARPLAVRASACRPGGPGPAESVAARLDARRPVLVGRAAPALAPSCDAPSSRPRSGAGRARCRRALGRIARVD